MFEVVLTLRPDFTERVAERCATETEAQEVARRISADRPDEVVRVWVRRPREVQSRE
jgi:hypothetical protein